MKQIMSILISLTFLFTNTALADCEWASGVKKQDIGYLYSSDCHGRVGVLIKDLEDRERETISLRKALDLKDQALQKADERIMLWRDESYEQFDRLQKQSELSKRNETLYFILGIVVTSAAVWGAGQLR